MCRGTSRKGKLSYRDKKIVVSVVRIGWSEGEMNSREQEMPGVKETPYKVVLLQVSRQHID